VIEHHSHTHDAEMAVRLLDGSPDGLLLVDVHGHIELANRSASTMFGYEPTGPGSLIGRSVDDLVPDEQRHRHVGLRRRYDADPQRRPMGTGLRLLAQHRGGDMFPVEISLSPVAIESEMHTVAMVRDVTERQETQTRLLLHEERARIAHDLHDLVLQRMFAAGLSLQSVTNLIDSPVARDRVIAVIEELDETVSAVRAAIFSIGNHDAAQSLKSHLYNIVDDRSRDLGFTPDMTIVGPVDDVPDFVGDQLVATLIEALSNVADHADASDATIRITRTAQALDLVVRDNGRGIVTTPKAHGRMSSLMWHAAELGGSCSVTPAEPSGIELVWRVPI